LLVCISIDASSMKKNQYMLNTTIMAIMIKVASLHQQKSLAQ